MSSLCRGDLYCVVRLVVEILDKSCSFCVIVYKFAMSKSDNIPTEDRGKRGDDSRGNKRHSDTEKSENVRQFFFGVLAYTVIHDGCSYFYYQ